ncbi:unnamed protein product [Caenorhabditis nigoni]
MTPHRSTRTRNSTVKTMEANAFKSKEEKNKSLRKALKTKEKDTVKEKLEKMKGASKPTEPKESHEKKVLKTVKAEPTLCNDSKWKPPVEPHDNEDIDIDVDDTDVNTQIENFGISPKMTSSSFEVMRSKFLGIQSPNGPTYFKRINSSKTRQMLFDRHLDNPQNQRLGSNPNDFLEDYSPNRTYHVMKPDMTLRSDVMGTNEMIGAFGRPYVPIHLQSTEPSGQCSSTSHMREVTDEVGGPESIIPSYMKRLKPIETNDHTYVSHAIENGRWNPINFGMQYLYDAENGVSRSRQECEEAIERLTRNVREVDFQPFLDLASSFHGKDERMEKLCVGLAFNTINNNRVIQKLKKDNTAQLLSTAQVVEGQGFSLTNAKKYESVIELPSKRTFRMSQLLSAGQASKFTSSDFLEHAKGLYRVCFKKLASMDEYFGVYTASGYSSLGYHPFGDEFFKKTSKFVCDGFGQQFTKDLEASCTCAAREVLMNLIDRIRKELKKLNHDTVTTLHQLKHVIAQDAEEIDRSLLDPTRPPIQHLLCLS